MGKRELYQYIKDFYDKNGFEMAITNRICAGLTKAAMLKFSEDNVVPEGKKDTINDFLLAEKTLSYIKEKQPEISSVPDAVAHMVKEYFQKNLRMYNYLKIFRSSNHPEDNYLYSVLGFHDNGTFSCWTCFNSRTESLNYGHYGLQTEDMALEILSSYYHDITAEPEKYGILESRREIPDVKKMEEKQETVLDTTNVIPFRPRRGR